MIREQQWVLLFHLLAHWSSFGSHRSCWHKIPCTWLFTIWCQLFICTDAMCFLLSCIFFSPALFVTRYGILHCHWCIRLLLPPPTTVNVCYIFQRGSLCINALHACVYIYCTSGSSALLGRPHGLSILPSLVAIFNILFWVYAHFLHEKRQNTDTLSLPSLCDTDGHQRLRGMQSINSERALTPQRVQLTQGQLVTAVCLASFLYPCL